MWMTEDDFNKLANFMRSSAQVHFNFHYVHDVTVHNLTRPFAESGDLPQDGRCNTHVG